MFAAAMLALAAGLIMAPPAQATTTFVVANGDVTGPTGLIAAIIAANDEGTNPGADTIELAAGGMYTLTAVHNTNDGDNGLPSITSEIIIDGNGSTIYRGTSSTPDFRIFHVQSTCTNSP